MNALKRYEKSKNLDRTVNPAKPRAPYTKRKPKPVPPRTNKYPKRGSA